MEDAPSAGDQQRHRAHHRRQLRTFHAGIDPNACVVEFVIRE
jgi:hypothetical protein